MAIAARTNPELIVNGLVKGTREIKSKDTGEVFGSNVSVETASGVLYVTMWDRDHGDVDISVGLRAAVVVTVEEGARGAQLTFQRFVGPSDLDLIVSDSGLSAK